MSDVVRSDPLTDHARQCHSPISLAFLFLTWLMNDIPSLLCILSTLCTEVQESAVGPAYASITAVPWFHRCILDPASFV